MTVVVVLWKRTLRRRNIKLLLLTLSDCLFAFVLVFCSGSSSPVTQKMSRRANIAESMICLHIDLAGNDILLACLHISELMVIGPFLSMKRVQGFMS